VTGAESAELVLALDAVAPPAGDPRARRLLTEVQQLRHESGLYWTGWVVDDGVPWPDEQTTYTAAAVVLAADALSRATPGNGVLRGDASSGLPAVPLLSSGSCDLAGCPA
jgi:hypothetical protein